MSKNLIASLLISVAGFSAFAANSKNELLTVIKTGRYEISDKSLAESCDAGKICVPSSRAIIAQSKLNLTLPLLGCLDSAFVTYKISDDEATGMKTVYVSALNVKNKKSETVRCIAAPMAKVTIDLKESVMDKSLLKVEFLQDIAQ